MLGVALPKPTSAAILRIFGMDKDGLQSTGKFYKWNAILSSKDLRREDGPSVPAHICRHVMEAVYVVKKWTALKGHDCHNTVVAEH